MNRAAAALSAAALSWTAMAALSVRAEDARAGQRLPIEQTITFDDLAPHGLVLEQCWDAIGMDSQGRVYIGFTSKRPDGREDVAVFRYTPETGERRFLGTFMDVSQAAGNLAPNEQIPKGHTHIVEAQGRMYMASQGFHDLKGPIDSLPTYRGAHLYAYDTATDRLEEVSRSLPGGVLAGHTGVIALSAVPGRDLLAGLAHPTSDIILYDHARRQVTTVPGIPWQLGNPLSREIVATKQGKIFTYRGTEDPAQRVESHPVWVYDLNTGINKPTRYSATGGFWNGQARTRDGETIYLSTVNGELYRLDTASDVISPLGPFLPKADVDAGERIDQLYGITLSADEKKIYGVPRTHRSKDTTLYAYDIASGTVSAAGKLDTAVYAGSDVRDSRGNIYMGRFGDADRWEGKAGLAVIRAP
ncbi:MAG TPA: hypothetical protein VKY24_23245 [Reyranella sp.]|nr:hypothetical protein [Reyranella sp.]